MIVIIVNYTDMHRLRATSSEHINSSDCYSVMNSM